MDSWHDVGHDLNLNKKGKLGQKIKIFLLVHARVREERNKRVKSFSLRSTRFRRSEFVRSRIKVHRIDESYVWVLKTQDFAEMTKPKIFLDLR